MNMTIEGRLMKKMVLAAVITCVIIMQTGCGDSGAGRTPEQKSTAVQQETTSAQSGMTQAALQTQSQSTQQAESKNVAMYVTEVYASLKVIDGYTDDASGRKDYERQILDDRCLFYNYEGEQIAFSELGKAVHTYMQNSTKGVLCDVKYSGRSIVSIKISDKEADIANTVTIQPTLFYHMN